MEKHKLVFVEDFPSKQDFTAFWFVDFKGKQTMFCTTMYYNEEEDQYYTYESSTDFFLPECDHGYSEDFFERVNASYLIKE